MTDGDQLASFTRQLSLGVYDELHRSGIIRQEVTMITLTVNSYADVGEIQTKRGGGRTTDSRPTTTIGEQSATNADTCRCLFGPTDDADNAATLASLRAAANRLSAARWDFDFTAGRPLPGGRYDWTEVVSLSLQSTPPPPTKRRHAVALTSSRCRPSRKAARFDDVIRNVAACAPASRQHGDARRRRRIIPGIQAPPAAAEFS